MRPEGALPKAWKAYIAHRASSKQRGIPFLMTWEEWWGFWSVDGRWERRGRGTHKLVMARYGDVGPYAVGNVFCCTNGENTTEGLALGSKAEWTPGRRAAMSEEKLRMHRERPEIANHLRDRANHPMRKPVRTPLGVFPSCALAGDAHGLTRQRISQLARSGLDDWGYVE